MILEKFPKSLCPICNKPTSAESSPFCSPRCSAVDLGRWLGAGYRLDDETGAMAVADDDDEPSDS